MLCKFYFTYMWVFKGNREYKKKLNLQTHLNNIIKVRVLIAISYIVVLLFFW